MIRSRTPTPPLVAAFASLMLCACNSAHPPAAEPAAASRSVTPPDFTLPQGAGCAGAAARYRAILDNDLAMGHVGRGVFDQIQREIDEAAACSAGRDAQAISLIRASKARHGYPG